MSSPNVPVLYINTQLVPSTTSGNPSKNVLLIGQRIITDGTLTPGNAGVLNYYMPTLLPSFSDGNAVLSYFESYGFNVKRGIDFTLALPAPDTVVIANGITTISWTVSPSGFNQLTDFALSGALTQGLLSGQVYQAFYVSSVATMQIYGSIAYVTSGDSGADMSLSGTNNVFYPDPELTDPIVCMCWDFYQSKVGANSSALGSPSAYISILSDRDSTITPSDTGILLGDPAAVTTGTVSTLTYPLTTEGLGYLPITAWGSTTVTQAVTNATGTYGGYEIVGSNVIITVTGVTGGTFTTAEAVTVTLDNEINAFNFLNNIDIYGAVQQFPIFTIDDITTTYADFFNGVIGYNAPQLVNNRHFYCYAVAGISEAITPANASSLPAPNNAYFILTHNPYFVKFGNIPYGGDGRAIGAGRFASGIIYMLANGDTPYPNLTNAVIPHFPVSSTLADTYSSAPGGTGSIAISRGILPMYINSAGVTAFLQSNTSLITIPNTTTPNTEFSYTHIWDSVRWYKREIADWYAANSILPNNQGTVLISPNFLKRFRAALISIARNGESLGMFENVSLYENLFSATQDQNNPNQVDAFAPCQIIPSLNVGNVLINVFSSLFQFNNSNA